jgi:hypothetical protein
MHTVNPLSSNATYSIILLCLMPDYFTLSIMPDSFTRQGESAVTYYVKVIPMSLNMLPISLCDTILLTFI